MTPPRTATTEARGAFLAGEAPASPAIFDNKIVLPIYQLADIPRDPIGTLIYFYKEGRAIEQRCQYRRGFKREVIPNHADSIPTSEVIHK